MLLSLQFIPVLFLIFFNGFVNIVWRIPSLISTWSRSFEEKWKVHSFKTTWGLFTGFEVIVCLSTWEGRIVAVSGDSLNDNKM